MDYKTFSVSLESNPKVSANVITGHFATRESQTHISHYLDISAMKSNAQVARDAARELAQPYLSSTRVDTIVCMDKTEVIGAYIAEELLNTGVNRDGEIFVLTPASNVHYNLVFQDSMIGKIADRNIILLVAWVISGQTVDRALECFAYYGGKSAGISTLFLASHNNHKHKINTLFTSEDIPGYKLFSPGQCDMCREGRKLDAIVSYEGYTNIRELV